MNSSFDSGSPNRQAKDGINCSAKPWSQKLSLKAGRKGSEKSTLALISSPRLVWLMCGRLKLRLDTNPNVSLLIQSLSEQPELFSLANTELEKAEQALWGYFLFVFTCGWARNTSKIDFLVTFEVIRLGCLPELELYRKSYLWGHKFRSELSSGYPNKWPAFQKRSHDWTGSKPGVPHAAGEFRSPSEIRIQLWVICF